MASNSGFINCHQPIAGDSTIRHFESRQQHALVNESDFPDFNFDLVDADYLDEQKLLLGTSEGRGTVWFLRNPDSSNNTQYVLRAYLRGGLISHVFHDQYFHLSYRTSRAWNEFKLLQLLHNEGLPVPRPVAAVVKRSGIVLRSFLITERISGAKDLHECLLEAPLANDMWQRIGHVIGLMHKRSVYHHDLNLRNILLDDASQPWLIDFDKCRFRKTGSWEEGNLERLKRSFNKEKGLRPELHYQPDCFEQLLVGYLKGR